MATAELDPLVQEFTAKERPMLIGDEWMPAMSGKTFETYDPSTGEVLANVAEGDKQDIDRAVKAAQRAFEEGPWGKLTPSERGRLVNRIGDLIMEHAEELATLETLDNGKPFAIAKAADIPLAADPFLVHVRLGHEARRTHHGASRPVQAGQRVARLHPPGACGSGGADHPLEFPAADGGLEARPGTRLRQHRCAEAR